MKFIRAKQRVIDYGHAAGTVLAETLWLTRCAVCDKPGELLCPSCEKHLPYIDTTTACQLCGAPFGKIQCCECNNVMYPENFPLTRMASATVLDERTRRIITTYKDSAERRLAHTIAEIMTRYVEPDWTIQPAGFRKPIPQVNSLPQNAPSVITYIPATKDALMRRGFDHAQLLANSVASCLGLECQSLLLRPKAKDQRRLSRRERLENMTHLFSCIPQIRIPKRIIIVDDVCTTGATLYAAAEELRQKGAETIYGLTFARA